MRVYQVSIRNFRGIQELDWTVGSQICCLVGPGDSCKSTILDAIELVLSPRYRLYLDDTDFHNLNVNELISIMVTLGPPPEPLMTESRFGMCLRGWSLEDGLHDEPEGLIPVLTVCLTVGSSLEPSWTVVTDREPDGRRISAADRAHFGAVGLGVAPEWQLSWRRGSILSRLTGDTDVLPEILARASRAARLSLEEHGDQLEDLLEAAERAQALGVAYGVAPQNSYRPDLDVQAGTIREGGMSLHDGNVPIRRAGLGTRRLLSLALQRDASCDSGGITLIDEVEYGLEPHRVRHLITNLGGKEYSPPEASDEGDEQIIMATHSPIVVEQLDARNINVVRNDEGVVTTKAVPGELQSVVRKCSEALLARKILVCEGKTEPGIMMAMDTYWSMLGEAPFSTCGVALVPGGGRTHAPTQALRLSMLGYDVAYFGDSDEPMEPAEEQLVAAGVAVFVWGDETATEDRCFIDLPWIGVLDVLAASEKPTQAIRDSASYRGDGLELPQHVEDWVDSLALREALAEASESGEWFKRVDLGQRLGEIICKHWDAIQGSNLASVLTGIGGWAHPSV